MIFQILTYAALGAATAWIWGRWCDKRNVSWRVMMLGYIGFLIIMLLCTPRPALAAESWDKTEVLAQGVYEGLRVTDWMQTRYIAAHPAQFYEGVNPILGHHPSKDKVDLYFLATTFTQAWIADNLPRHYSVLGIDLHPRKLWIAAGIGLEYSMVRKNVGVNIKVQW